MAKGIGVSPGVAVGTAYCIHEIFVNPSTRRLAADEVRPELARYEKARDAAAADLRSLYTKVASQVGKSEAAIFQAHESILHDPAFNEKIRHWIVDAPRNRPLCAGPGLAGICEPVRADQGPIPPRAAGGRAGCDRAD